MTRVRLVPLVVGVALAAAGVLLLLRNLGLLPTGLSVWPVLVIAVGVVVLLAGLRQADADEPPDAAAAPLDAAAEARLVLKHGAGVLDLTGGAPADRLFEGTFAGGVRQQVTRQGGRLEATLTSAPDPERLFRQSRGLRWTVAVTGAVPLDLELQTGAARVSADLTGTQLRLLRVQTGASEVDVRLPATGRTSVRVSAGAADVRLHVPEGVAAAITNRSALASVSVDQARFPVWGGGHRSPDYDTAAHRVDIDLDGGVASFRVD